MTSRSVRTLSFILLAVGMVGSFFIFIAIAEDYVTQDSLVAYDLHIAQIISGSRSQLPLHFYYAVTVLMNATTVLCTGILLTFMLWRKRAVTYVLILWLALAGGTSTMLFSKTLFHRNRPFGFLPIVSESSYSFPSGHATAAAIMFGLLAYLFVREPHGWIAKLSAVAGAAIMIVLIDLSRLYLGVHYVSDVLAGNALGFSVLLASIFIGEWYRVRHHEKLLHIQASVFTAVALLQMLCLLGFLLLMPLEF